MDAAMISSTLDASARLWFSVGLGAAFVLTLLGIIAFMKWSRIDHGFLGLMFLLTLIFFLIAFSFLVAASVSGVGIKVAVSIVDSFVLFGSKLLAPRFLQYLES